MCRSEDEEGLRADFAKQTLDWERVLHRNESRRNVCSVAPSAWQGRDVLGNGRRERGTHGRPHLVRVPEPQHRRLQIDTAGELSENLQSRNSTKETEN